MNKRLGSLLLLFSVATLCFSAYAQDQSNDQTANVAGTWQISWQGRNGTQQGTLQLQEDGSNLSGTFKGPRGSTSLTGSLQGNNISFNVQMQARRTITISFTGSVESDKMSGSLQMQGGRRRGGNGQSRTWSATRQAASANQSGTPNQGS